MEWYQQNIETIINQFNSNAENGLDEKAVLLARKKFGNNSLKATHTRNVFKILFAQFISPLNVILIVAALISLYLGKQSDGGILLLIVTINALIGFYQEWKAENILASLKMLVIDKCLVIRGGNTLEIFSNDLVPGDVVKLTEGDGVPADIRLIFSKDFSANEFILTGESLPAIKEYHFSSDKKLNSAEIKNCVFMGTTIARGVASGIVYATGGQTEIGKISTSSQKIKATAAPIQIEIADVAKKLTIATLIIGVLIFLLRLLLNDSIAAALVFSVSIAAAMVPEGLPAQISTALALAVARLSKRKAIVKKIAAAQTLGSATVIASDKTGTITKNEMTITGCYFNGKSFSVSGLGYEPLGSIADEKGIVLKKDSLGELKIFFLSGFLSSTGKINPPDNYHKSWYCIGDPTEASFATLAMKAGFTLEEIENNYSAIKIFRFDSFRKRATIIRKHQNKIIASVKGSIESVLEVSTKIITDGKTTELSADQKKQIISMSTAFSQNALRIIAIAYKDLTIQNDYTIEDAEQGLTFAGFVTMFDPPNEEVKTAIESVFKANMKVFMITGDNEVTAKAIAKNIGLLNEGNELPIVINGATLQTMSDEQLKTVFLNRALIFSRVSPDDKFRVVDLLMKQGEIVAVTGDGVNDTLSLKRADIGVAMGKNGSKVAQEAANMILLDDNFSTIVVAVKEGRTIFWNLEKNIKINLACNLAELSCVLFGFAGAFLGIETPILAVHILLIDMVGELFPLMMLTYDPPEKNIMENHPRNPKEKILTTATMKGIAFDGMVLGIAAYCTFLLALCNNPANANNYLKAMTITFLAINFGLYANILSRRTCGIVFSRYLFSNPYLLFAFAISISCLILLVYVPTFNLYFHTAPLKAGDWLFPFGAGVVCLLIYEIRKKISSIKNFPT